MSSERDDCIDRIVRAAGGKISRKEAMDALDELLARAERRGPSAESVDERLAEAAKEIEENIRERATVLKRNERMDTLKTIERHRYYDRAPTPALGVAAKLGGINAPFAGNRLSVDYQYKAIKRQLAGGFVMDMDRAGLTPIFASGKLEVEWATELAELNKTKGGKAGITNSPQALEIAKLIHKWQKVSIDTINREGGWVKSYSGYITRTSHDPDKIRRAGRDKWVDDVLKRIDIERTFHDKDEISARKLLGELWGKFKVGDHMDYGKPLEDLDDGLLQVDFARKASSPRELHFRTANDWLAYNRQYGMGGPTETVMNAFDRAAKTTALLREFGSQPRLAFEQDIHYLKNKFEQTDRRGELDIKERYLRNLFGQFDGTANRPVNRTHARIAAGVMATQRLAKLGLTPFAMLADLATKASELRYQGVGFFDRWSGSVTGYFKGAEGTEKRQVADLLYATVAARIGDIASRFDGADTPAGWISRAENWFFRVTGISPMTFNQRADAEVMMARHLGQLRDTKWGDLDAPERRILQGFDIGQHDWDLLHKVDWHDFGGRTYLTPDVAHGLGAEDVRAALVAKNKLHREAKGQMVDFMVEKERGDLALKLSTYFADRGEFAILEPGARERTMLYQGTQPGTKLGTALRLWGQFKQFPATMLTKGWGREIYGGQGKMGALAGLTELIVSSTALGMLANFLNATAKGQDPTSQWRNQPLQAFLAGFLRGGAGTIYGDFMLGEWSRFGLSAAATLAGPTIGQVDRLAEFWADITHARGRQGAALGTRMVRENLPFMNMIYTKALFDYLIFYRIQEAINPGYLQRMEQTMRDKQGIEFNLRPSQIAR